MAIFNRTGAGCRAIKTQFKKIASSLLNRLITSIVHGCVIAGVLFPIFGSGSPSALEAALPSRANISRETRLESIAEMPFEKLTEKMQEKLSGVVNKPSIFRRITAPPVPCDPKMHLFLVRYPEVVVNIWHLLGITNVSVKRTGTYTFDVADGAGTNGNVQLVYGTPNIHIMFADAVYDGPRLAIPLRAKCVLFLKSNFTRTENGKLHVTDQLDAFVQVEHKGVDLLAKTFHPLFGRTADNNFRESIKFLSKISMTAEKNNPAIQRLATQLKNIDPSIRREFAKISASTSRQTKGRLIKTSKVPSVDLQRNLQSATAENLARTIFSISPLPSESEKSSWMSR